MNLKQAIHYFQEAMNSEGISPEKGLGTEGFQFASTLMPVVNVDLIVINENAEQYLWDAIEAYADYSFRTEKGLSMKYSVKGGEIYFDREEKSVTRSSVMEAFHRARQLQQEKGFVSGPKELGTFGASCLYPVFLRLGVCKEKPEIF